LGHAILMARELVGEEPFAVLLGDDIIHSEKPCLRQMLDVYESNPSSVIAIQEVAREAIPNYGIISGKPITHNGQSDRLYQVTDLVEKPPIDQAPSNLAIIGRYILEPEIFNVLASTTSGAGGEIQLTDGLHGLLRNGQSIFGYRFEGKRYDAGDKLGFLAATVEFALRRPDLGEAFRQYLKNLNLQ